MAENRAAQLLATLAHVGLDDTNAGTEGDIHEMLDALVLAAIRSGDRQMEDLAAEAPADAPLQSDADTDDSCDDSTPEPGSDAGSLGGASVWLKEDSSSHSIPGSPVSIGRAPALPNALAIGRALRPLRRFRPSRVHQRLDLDATVEQYTRTGVLVPQLAPAAVPWLEAVLVMDCGSSMTVWDETSLALTQLLRTLSAFRSIVVWRLEHSPQAEPVLRNHHGRLMPMDPSDPRHCQPAHRLLLVFSDCAAPAWRQSKLWQTLHTWGRTAPVALINPLPKRLWQRSGLDLPRTTTTASVPASPGRLLAYRRPRLLRDDAPGTQPWQALPVLQMDPQHILAWARTMMRTDPRGCEAVLIPASGRVPPRNHSRRQVTVEPDAPTTDAQLTAAAHAFTDNLHSPAVRLAIAASTLDAFTLPVLDVLRERIVPDAALADTAEFLTAGLLTATRHKKADTVYRFHPAAAEHLRGLLSRDQAWDAHFALTDHLKSHPQAPHGIVAALHSPKSQEMLPTGLRPVAQAAAATARLLGVESIEPYSGPDALPGVAARSRDGQKGDAQQTPAPAMPDDPPEPAPDVEVAPHKRPFDGALMLRAHQRHMLDRLNSERELHDRHRNLLVAPPGTGKTTMAAFDYQHLCEQHQQDLSLLFVAGSVAAVDQARPTYQVVLSNPHFGEFLYGAGTLERGNHVFATWQSLDRVMDQLQPDHFDVIVIDDSYAIGTRPFANILERFAPRELLVLSAAPERPNGPGIHEMFFEGRIAAEMRLPDALATGVLSPVHYFGFADGTDLQGLDWKGGRYDRDSLNDLLTGDDARAGLVIHAVRDTVPDVRVMRAVGFCESVAHAEFMTRRFRDAGFRAATFTARDRLATRRETLSSLRSGGLQIVFCVDALSEGIDIPEVNTLLLLRPPSSATRFLRHLSVGLPRFPGKSVLTVLDFIGHHREEVRLDSQLRAMTDLTAGQLLDHLEHGSTRLNDGFMITLDEKARILLTNSLREQVHGNTTDKAEGNRVGKEQRSAEQLAAPFADLATDTDPASNPPAMNQSRAFDQSPRVVMVRATNSTASDIEAGIMLTPRLVLTCAHMADAAGSRPRVVGPGGTEITFRTMWKGQGVDAALIFTDENILDSDDWERLLPLRLKWGRLPKGLMSSVRVAGFGRSGEPTELSGQARPTDVRLIIEGTEPFTADALAASPGALVSCDGVFVGMVTRRHPQRPQLMALPAALLLQDQGFRRALATHMTTPYELEDIGSGPPDDASTAPNVVCLAVEVQTVGGQSGTHAPHMELELTHGIRDSLTAIMRRAGIDGVVAEELAVADRRVNLLVKLDSPTPVQDMGRVLAELQTAVAAPHNARIEVGASFGEVADTRRGLVGGAVSQAVRLASNTFFREQVHQAELFADSPVHFAVSNTLHVLMADMLDPSLKDRFVPLGPSAQPDTEAGWLYEGSTEDLGRALAAGFARRSVPTTASSYRNRLATKHQALADAEKKVSEFRTKEADWRAKATKDRSAAARTASAGIQSARLRSAQRHEAEASRAAHNASIWSAKAARYGREAADLAAKLAEAEQAEPRVAASQARTESRLSTAEAEVRSPLKKLRAPKPEKLRVLLLGATSDSDLRIPGEQQRICAAVRSVTHRDLIELEAHPTPTTGMLLNALSRFRPHVVHLSSHSANEQSANLVHGHALASADALARAIAAVDNKPLIVLFKSSLSEIQITQLVAAIPFVIAMPASIGEVDAITYAARFYAAIADGQSVHAAHLLSRVAVEMNGLDNHHLPSLSYAADIDPSASKLVTPPPV